MACRRWKPPVPKRSVTASIPPMSCSTSWPGNASPLHRQHHDAGRTDAPPCADRRSCPLRQPPEDQLMERTQIFDLMGELKLYGMKAAFEEIMATAVKRQHEPQRIVGDLLNAEI